MQIQFAEFANTFDENITNRTVCDLTNLVTCRLTNHHFARPQVRQIDPALFVNIKSQDFHVVHIAHVLLQVDPGEEVLVAGKTCELDVAVLLGYVLLEGMFLNGFKFTVIAVEEEAHVLRLGVRLQAALPLGLVGAHVAAEHQLERQIVRGDLCDPSLAYLLVDRLAVALEVALLAGRVVAVVALVPQLRGRVLPGGRRLPDQGCQGLSRTK